MTNDCLCRILRLTGSISGGMQDVFTVGSHPQSHRVLTTLPLHVANEEIFASKALLEDQLGSAVQFFSYPKGAAGQFSQPLEDMVRVAGYAMGLTDACWRSPANCTFNHPIGTTSR